MSFNEKNKCPAKYSHRLWRYLRFLIVLPKKIPQLTPAFFKMLCMLSVFPLAILVVVTLSNRVEAATSADCVQQGGRLPCVNMTFGPRVYRLNGYQFQSPQEQPVIDEFISWYGQQVNSSGYKLVCPGSFTYSSTPWSSTLHSDCQGPVPVYTNGAESLNTKVLPFSYSTSSYIGSCPGGTLSTSACMLTERSVGCPDGYTMTGFRAGYGFISYEPSVQYCAPSNFISYTINLQNPLADVEPSGTTDIYANTSSTVYAPVINVQTKQPRAGALVKFSVEVAANSGGHNHDNGL